MLHFKTEDPTHNSLEAAILDQKVAGVMRDQPYAYVAVIGGSKVWTIGIAVEGQDGYNPIEGSGFEFDNDKEVTEFVNGMNKHIGLDPYRAIQIVTSTMRGTVRPSY